MIILWICFKCSFNVTLRRVYVTIVAVEKQLVLNNLSVCLYFAFVIWNVKLMRHIVILDLSDPAMFFFTLSLNGANFGETLLTVRCAF